MLSRNALISALAFSCLFVAQSATAQPRWGRERLPSAGACFYEDRDFRGQYFCVQPGERLRLGRHHGGHPGEVLDDRHAAAIALANMAVVRDATRDGWVHGSPTRARGGAGRARRTRRRQGRATPLGPSAVAGERRSR